MSGPLNRLPLGLLSFLELKSPAGRYPVQLADQLVPVTDLERYYRPQAHRGGLSSQAAGAITGANRFSVFTAGTATIVPQGEIWYLAEYTVEIALQADQSITYAPALGIFIGALAAVYRLGDYVTIATGALAGLGMATAHYSMPRIIGPGMRLGITVMNFVAGASLSTTATGSFHRFVLSG